MSAVSSFPVSAVAGACNNRTVTAGDEVGAIWEPPDGGSSQTIGAFDVPS